MKNKLILLRHGESIWNLENRFTGWTDVDLTKNGENEAFNAGVLLSNYDIQFDLAFVSYLKRAIKTLTTILKKNNLELKFNTAWQLNERHYGSLTGLNKEETKKKIGEEQFKKYRRSWDVAPPAMEEKGEYQSATRGVQLAVLCHPAWQGRAERVQGHLAGQCQDERGPAEVQGQPAGQGDEEKVRRRALPG